MLNPIVSRRLALPAVVLVALVSIGSGLGDVSLWEPDEPRFAEATRQMFARGDFLTPYFNGVPRFEKPILLYWLQAVAFLGLGDTELAARLPAAAAGVGSAILLFLLTARIATRRAAFIAAVALATMFRFVAFSRQGLTDIPAVFFNVTALYGFIRAAEGAAAPWAAWLAWAAVGLGLLTKGPVGALSIPIWAAYAAASRHGLLVRRIRPLAGPALAAVIAAPWYLAMVAMHGRAFTDFALGHEVVARMLSETSFAPTRSLWYYFEVWPGDAAPWSLVFVSAVAWSAARYRRLEAGARRPILFAAVWFLAVFVLFSLSRSKVPHYVLPAYPAAALMIGVFVDRLADDSSAARWWRVPMSGVAMVSLAAAVVLGASTSRLMPGAPHAVRFAVPVVLALGGVSVALALGRSSPVPATVALTIMLSATFGIIGAVVIPASMERFKPMPSLAREADRLALPGARIGLLGRYGASSLIYYSRHNVEWLSDDESTLAFVSGEPRAVCVMPSTDFERLMSRLPATIRPMASAEEFNVRIERILERQATPGRQWVLLANPAR